MSLDNSAKNLGIACFYISISASSNIAKALRDFLTAVKYANVKYGEDHYKDYLAVRGHRFKSDINLARVALDKKKSNIERVAVTQEDKRILMHYAHKYGLDFALTERPKDFDVLLKKKYIDKQEMTAQEEKIIKAFTYRDEKGNTIMDPEKPGYPLVNDAAYMLTIASVDLDRWEIICREMEARSHVPSFDERLKKGIDAWKIQNIKVKSKVQDLLKKIRKDKGAR